MLNSSSLQANVAAAGGGGGSISLAKTAWVETAANGGNDATAEIGNPAKPFATMQAAYDHADAPRTFYVGAGTHAGITTTGSPNINILGLGISATTISLLRTTTLGGTITINDLGVHTFTASTIGFAPAPPGTLETGGDGVNVSLGNVRCILVITSGQQGGSYDADEDSGAGGGPAGYFSSLGGCWIDSIVANGGDGGAGGPSGGIGGSGGLGPLILLSQGDNIVDITANGGAGSTGGGGSGNGGNAGTIEGSFFKITDVANLAAGSGATPGFGGLVDINHAYIEELNGDDGAGNLSITCHLSEIVTTGGTPTLTLVELSKVNGTVY